MMRSMLTAKDASNYIDYLVNQSSIRQWSLKKLADYGFDAATGIWQNVPATAVWW